MRQPPDEKGRRPLAKGAAKVSAHQPDHQDHTRPGDRAVLDRLEALEQQLWDEEHAAEPWPWGWPDGKDWP